MDVFQLYFRLLQLPGVPKPYRDLQDYYASVGMENEAEAFRHLIEKKFGKNESNYGSPNNTE